MKKRFIAGARCPSCNELDKLMVYKENGDDYRECISCGFKDKMLFKQVHREPVTRVNQTEQDKKAMVQTLKFPPEE